VRKLQQARSGELKWEFVDLNQVMADLQAQYARYSGKTVSIRFDPCLACPILANGLIKDVFANLIWNAIKHSDGQAVDIGLDVARYCTEGSDYCQIAVEDNGPGIPDELKARIFVRFQRGNTKAHGKGLGLYLVKSLVESYGGKVWVEDRVPGDHTKGAKFVVRLPIASQKP
jgi:signal transduction histidine kinase